MPVSARVSLDGASPRRPGRPAVPVPSHVPALVGRGLVPGCEPATGRPCRTRRANNLQHENSKTIAVFAAVTARRSRRGAVAGAELARRRGLGGGASTEGAGPHGGDRSWAAVPEAVRGRGSPARVGESTLGKLARDTEPHSVGRHGLAGSGSTLHDGGSLALWPAMQFPNSRGCQNYGKHSPIFFPGRSLGPITASRQPRRAGRIVVVSSFASPTGPPHGPAPDIREKRASWSGSTYSLTQSPPLTLSPLLRAPPLRDRRTPCPSA